MSLAVKVAEKLFLVACGILVLAGNGCATYHREKFLESHSMDRFIEDRPAAARLLAEHPALGTWLRTQWKAPIGEYRIYWSNDQPAVSMAEHGLMPEYKLIVIRVSQNLVPADQLEALVFEICNAQQFSNVDALDADAAAGHLTREDYLNRINRLEFEAVLRVKTIFPPMLPLSREDLAATNLYRYLLKVPDDFHEYEKWSSSIPNSNYQRNQKFYGQRYDRLVKKQ
jgi:hypothetical protein